MTAPAPAGTETSPSRRAGWWRRNWFALGVLAVVLPATAYVVLGLPVLEILGRTPPPVAVAAKGSAEAAGYSWKVLDSAEFPGTGASDPEANGIPVGTSLVAAIVQATPGEDAPAERSAVCTAALTDRHPELGERTWAPLIDPSAYRYRLGSDTTTICDPSSGEPFLLEVVFLTPAGTYDDPTLDLSLSGSGLTRRGGTVLRFALDG